MPELPLIAAIRKGNLEKVHQLLAEGYDVNEHGIEDRAKALSRNIDVTPLIVAAEEGREEIVDSLLSAGADVNDEDGFKRTALMIAIRWKQATIAHRLLDSGAEPNAKDRSGETVLTQAINAGLWPLAHALLDAGAAARPRGKEDCLPLAVAAHKEGEGAASVIMRLLDAGAVPQGSYFLYHLVENQTVALVRRVLRDFPAIESEPTHDHLLQLAGKRRDLEMIQTLLEFGICPTNDPGEHSPLSGVIIGPARSSLEFCSPEHIDDAREIACLECLVAAGADVNHAPKMASVPLSFAIFFCRSGLCRWLLDHGADPNERERDQSLLDYTEKRHAETEPSRLHNEKEIDELHRQQDELGKIRAMLIDAGGVSASELPPEDEAGRPKEESRPQSRLQQSLDIPATPVARRRGVCVDGFYKAEQIMVRADLDKITSALAKDRTIDRVERDVFGRLDKFMRPVGDFFALVKLKGHDWVYVASGRRTHDERRMKAWSRKLKAPVLCAGEQSTAGVVYYWLFDRGECVEAFESDGQWFRGGVEIDPEVQDESERMEGTSFTSLRRDSDEIDWSPYESEYEFVDQFLRDVDAYLTFFGFELTGRDMPLELSAYHDDEATPGAIERVDLIFQKPTPQQMREASEPDPKDDPLLQAINSDELQAVLAAIEAGADVNALPPRNDSSYLIIAIGRVFRRKDLDIVDALLAAGADPNNGGYKPTLCRVAHWAGTSLDTLTVTHKLAEAGADVNLREPAVKGNPFLGGEQTALIIAAGAAKLNYMKLLLKHGADPTLKDTRGLTALDYAANWLREIKKDRLKEVPGFTDETSEPNAQATVELLEAGIEGTLDVGALPNLEELLKAEKESQARHA